MWSSELAPTTRGTSTRAVSIPPWAATFRDELFYETAQPECPLPLSSRSVGRLERRFQATDLSVSSRYSPPMTTLGPRAVAMTIACPPLDHGGLAASHKG